MTGKGWEEARLPRGEEAELWELFHENSKLGRFDRFLDRETILARMRGLAESLAYPDRPSIPLPEERIPLDLPLEQVLLDRASCRAFEPATMPLRALSTLLHFSYGVTRDLRAKGYPRPFRIVPSGGALYPLELYVASSRVEGLLPGLHHYDPTRNSLSQIREGDLAPELAPALTLQANLAFEASLFVFVTALFERSTFKYGARGYRFVLLEAGHLAQNLALVSEGLGLGCLDIGGYRDREIDRFLGIDGLSHSTVYVVAIGKKGMPR
jgi:SagB-type dehydrogenase family enzyme